MKLQLIRNDLQAIFKASDAILSRYSEKPDQLPDNIRGQGTIAALRDMTGNSESFSICTVRKLAEMNDVEISQEHWELFETLHTVKWNLMEEETREYLVAVLVNYFKPSMSTQYATYDVSN